jgi:hypothetical protein
MTDARFRVFITAFVIILALVTGFAILRVEEAATTSKRLAVANSVTTYESAKARVITVTQRCELTGLILGVVIRDDHRRAGPFEKSLAGCEHQLKEVKAIAERAKKETK